MSVSPYTHYEPSPPKSAKATLVENAVFLIVACSIVWVVAKFFDFLFKPLTKIFTHEESVEQVKDAMSVKQANREIRLDRLAEDSSDPMYQFSLRFLEKPEVYKGGAHNAKYREWYDQWKKGNVIDSTLRWAPQCLAEDGETLRPNFISYMKIQLDLHKRASWYRRNVFLHIISKYYPEFSPSLKGLETDLANYENESAEKGLIEELETQTNSLIPEELTKYLMDRNLSPTKFKRLALILKGYSDQGFCPEACICAVENKITNTSHIEMIHKIVSELKLPAKVGLAFVKGEIVADEISELALTLNELIEKYGEGAFYENENNGVCLYDGYLDAYLQEYKTKKRAAKVA